MMEDAITRWHSCAHSLSPGSSAGCAATKSFASALAACAGSKRTPSRRQITCSQRLQPYACWTYRSTRRARPSPSRWTPCSARLSTPGRQFGPSSHRCWTPRRVRSSTSSFATAPGVFVQCPHRMACARCDCYVPKGSSKAQLLEAKSNLQRMLVQIPLTDGERAAVEQGAAAVEQLLERLADTPTPAGPTPREMSASFIPLEKVIHRPIGD